LEGVSFVLAGGGQEALGLVSRQVYLILGTTAVTLVLTPCAASWFPILLELPWLKPF